MTIEGMPKIKANWEMEFQKQRKQRLSESVDEYMEDGSPLQFYNDLTDSIRELMDYHQKQKNHAQSLLMVINGHKPSSIEREDWIDQKYNLKENDYYDKRARLDAESDGDIPYHPV